MASLLPENRLTAKELDPTDTKTIGTYVLGKTLGKGTFGKVKAATHIKTGEKVAVKILEKEKIVDVADVERVSREIHILKLIRHPSIIQLYEIIETQKQLFLIMEYMEGGELFDYIVKSKKYAILTQNPRVRSLQDFPTDHRRYLVPPQTEHCPPRPQTRESSNRLRPDHPHCRLWSLQHLPQGGATQNSMRLPLLRSPRDDRGQKQIRGYPGGYLELRRHSLRNALWMPALLRS